MGLVKLVLSFLFIAFCERIMKREYAIEQLLMLDIGCFMRWMDCVRELVNKE